MIRGDFDTIFERVWLRSGTLDCVSALCGFKIQSYSPQNSSTAQDLRTITTRLFLTSELAETITAIGPHLRRPLTLLSPRACAESILRTRKNMTEGTNADDEKQAEVPLQNSNDLKHTNQNVNNMNQNLSHVTLSPESPLVKTFINSEHATAPQNNLEVVDIIDDPEFRGTFTSLENVHDFAPKKT